VGVVLVRAELLRAFAEVQAVRSVAPGRRDRRAGAM